MRIILFYNPETNYEVVINTYVHLYAIYLIQFKLISVGNQIKSNTSEYQTNKQTVGKEKY